MSLNNALNQWIQNQWYQRTSPNPLLKPLEKLFHEGVLLRQEAYQFGRMPSERLPVPVIVVGNLTVGGSGKTPLVVWLAQFLKSRGYRPGIVSRGYGGHASRKPLAVDFNTSPTLAGDEPVLIARRTGCPVFVSPQRIEAGRALLAQTECNIIIADDGLQHYALARDIEIVVIDGKRGFGNGHMLPAGPLREPVERLESVDMVVYNGAAPEGGHGMRLQGDLAVNLCNMWKRRKLGSFAGKPLNAMAGIGDPQRFFDHLARHGLSFRQRSWPDHHDYKASDLGFATDGPLLMTEKDAVKCRDFAREDDWYVPVEAHLPATFGQELFNLIKTKTHG